MSCLLLSSIVTGTSFEAALLVTETSVIPFLLNKEEKGLRQETSVLRTLSSANGDADDLDSLRDWITDKGATYYD